MLRDQPRRAEGAPLPVTVLSGFLGAGKTTVLRRLLREQTAHRVAVIVNDLSDLPVDAELVREAREGRHEIIIDLHGGSLGGTLRAPFREALDTLAADESVTYLVIETSGGTHPTALIAELEGHPGVQLDTFATIVDGLNLLRDHDGGRDLLATAAPDATSTRSLLRAQIAAASLLLVAKADLLTRTQAERLVGALQQVNPLASLMTMTYGRVLPERLLDTGSWARRERLLARAITSRHQADAPVEVVDVPLDDPRRFDLDAITIRDARPLHPGRLHTLISEALPVGVHRSKGWLWLASRPLDVLVWHQSGSHVALEWAATWKAGILEDTSARLRPEERHALTAQVRALHPVFGDRHCELTIIGHAR
ncbi:MAG TPA: GTP-binding protein, partial [Gemmatimonadaceae bacterium]|nr:GTP-binding protein [Gemmatimonadaceae bacterium]